MAAENRGPQVEGVAILFLILSWIFVAMRVYVRAVLMKGFGTDDWLAIAALVSTPSCHVKISRGVEIQTKEERDLDLEVSSSSFEVWLE